MALIAGLDHPRGCGENSHRQQFFLFSLGSPPRMRGKPAASTCWRVLSGITPADAGKTNPVFNVDFAYRDHPRGCGENSFLLIWDLRWSGSPPRMRGKRTHISKTVIRPGITPADAGKTAPFYCLYVTTGDHPRGCGENLYQSLYKLLFSGSPPRMRGKLHSVQKICQEFGITPADAGKTCKSTHDNCRL